MFGLKSGGMRLNWIFAMGVAVLMSIIGVMFLAGDEKIHACSCWNTSPAEALARDDAVFSGKVLVNRRVESGWFGFGHYHEIEFRVDAVWKGTVNETLFIYTLPDSASCGGWPWFEEDQEYVIYTRYTDPVRVWLCDRIRLLSEAEEDLEFLGEGMKPEPGSVSPTWTPPIEPTPEPTLTPTPVVRSTHSPQNESKTSGGGCNILVQSTDGPTDAWPLALIAGVAWLGFHKRSNRRD